MEINDRLNAIAKYKTNGNINAIAKLTGVGQSTIIHYFNEKSPSFDFITKLLNCYPDISAEWLMRGTGEMVRSDGANTINVEANNNHGSVDTSINHHSGDQSALVDELRKEIEFYRKLLLNTTANANATFSKG